MFWSYFRATMMKSTSLKVSWTYLLQMNEKHEYEQLTCILIVQSVENSTGAPTTFHLGPTIQSHPISYRNLLSWFLKLATRIEYCRAYTIRWWVSHWDLLRNFHAVHFERSAGAATCDSLEYIVEISLKATLLQLLTAVAEEICLIEVQIGKQLCILSTFSFWF